MTREVAIAIIVILAVIVLGAMLWGWRRRAKRDSGLAAPTTLPDPSAAPTKDTGDQAIFVGFYVATTVHDQPLERLAITHLAFRGRVRVAVDAQGISLQIPGEPTIFFAPPVLVGVGRATWAIDRVVERDGLVLLAWRASATVVADSYLRLPDRADAFVTAATALLPKPASTGSDA